MTDIYIQDAKNRCWLHFCDEVEIIETSSINEVISKLQLVTDRLSVGGLCAVGFLSYEASPAFDSSLCVKGGVDGLPLLWFGLYRRGVELRELPVAGDGYCLDGWCADIGLEDYERKIRCIKEYLAQGESYQVNFTYRLRSSFKGDVFSWFRRLSVAQQSANMAYINTGDWAICSASPELFFCYDSNLHELSCRPMKGTCVRGRDEEDDFEKRGELASCEKNRAENLMIVDMIRNDLGRIAQAGSVEVEDLFRLEAYPTVWQMTSKVKGVADGDLAKFFQALYPCASITGAPKVRTMEIIEELEDSPRGVYTGAIGFVRGNGDMQFNVPIRSAIVDLATGRVEYGVGGGIVWDSDGKKEYEETLAKAKILDNSNVEFRLLETILLENGCYFLLDEHLQRLANSARYFNYLCNIEVIRKSLYKLALQQIGGVFKVRLLVERSGYFDLEVYSLPCVSYGDVVKIRFAPKPIQASNLFLYHKTTNRSVYAGAVEATVDCDEPILWNQKGEVCESTIANVVIRKGACYLTPKIECGLLAGTYRQYLLTEGKIAEAIITKRDLQSADSIYLINSIRKWREATLLV